MLFDAGIISWLCFSWTRGGCWPLRGKDVSRFKTMSSHLKARNHWCVLKMYYILDDHFKKDWFWCKSILCNEIYVTTVYLSYPGYLVLMNTAWRDMNRKKVPYNNSTTLQILAIFQRQRHFFSFVSYMFSCLTLECPIIQSNLYWPFVTLWYRITKLQFTSMTTYIVRNIFLRQFLFSIYFYL